MGGVRSYSEENGKGADTDEALMSRIQQGDAQAFRDLVKRYERPLFNYCRRLTRNNADAEDTFQETFLRVYQHRERFRTTARFRPWVYRIATNLCRDALKYQKYRQYLSLDAPVSKETNSSPLADETASRAAGPDAVASAHETEARVANAVEQLPVKLRTVFLLARYEGLTYDEVAEALRIPTGTVKSRMNKAVRLLMQELEDLRP